MFSSEEKENWQFDALKYIQRMFTSMTVAKKLIRNYKSRNTHGREQVRVL